MSEFKRVLPDGSETTALALVDDQGRAQVVPQNITTKFREAFEVYTPNGTKWNQTLGSGDLVLLDGNAVGASYLVISKDPLTAGNETDVTTVQSFGMPLDAVFGLHMSQRTLGQEFSVELVSDEATQPLVADIAIVNVQQATTTLTVNTVAPHGLRPGSRFGIFGSVDSRLNYPALVVASIPSPTQFTATAGPGGSVPSLTVGPITGGYVYVRSSTGYAKNAVSMIFENATATNASFYVKTEGSLDVHPAGGVATGSHAVTVGSTASIQAVNAAYTYAFAPTTEFRINLQADRMQWTDVAVDSTGQSASRALRTQIVPDVSKTYKLRFRATNNKSLTVPVAQIVSAAKTGTTTATITTDVAHGLTVADQVHIVGIRDQANFANAQPLSVASVVNATQFTVVFGIAATATSFGGVVARMQGGMSVQGAQGVVLSTAAVAAGYLTIVANANFGGPVVGDLVNIIGARDNVSGVSMGIDGAYRVRNVSLATMELEPVGATVLPAPFATTNCGGAVIKRTDLRISFVRLFQFTRERVEMLPRPASDAAMAMPVAVSNAVGVTQGTRGTAGGGWWVNPDNTSATDVTSAAITTTTTTAAITPASPAGCAEFNIVVTAVSGTTPTLDLGIEESDDSGTNWIRIYDFPRITAAGAYRTPLLLLNGNRVRYVQTIGGTTPSFTRAITRIPNLMMGAANNVRQVIDRTIDFNTQGSTTGTLVNGTGASNVAFVVQAGAFTTAPVLQLQVSFDGVNWMYFGSTYSALTTSGYGVMANTNCPYQFYRVMVQTAGTGATAGQQTVTLRTF